MNNRTFKLTVAAKFEGSVEVKAETLEEAIQYAKDNFGLIAEVHGGEADCIINHEVSTYPWSETFTKF